MLIQKLEIILKKFTKKEKNLFWFLSLVLVLSFVFLLVRLNNKFSLTVPLNGGSYIEGVVGNPRFINPIIASSESDNDLVAIVYNGLTKKINNEIVNDLAESITISQNGLNYNVKIKEGVKFQDGINLTADDVVYTIETIQDEKIKSPLFDKWQGVTVEKVAENEVKFTLKNPFSTFKEELQVGILPKHIWSSISPENFYSSKYNLYPIGTGPFLVKKIYEDNENIVSEIKLTANKKYFEKRPFIKNLYFKFYGNTNDLIKDFRSNNIDGTGAIDQKDLLKLKNNYFVSKTPMTRSFVLFLNQNKNNLLGDKDIKKIINQVIDRDRIISEVLGNYANTEDNIINNSSALKISNEEISKKLDNIGYKLDTETGIRFKKTNKESIPLSISISTAQNEDIIEVANIIKENLERYGFAVKVNPFDIGILNQNVIKNRNFELLLFGLDISKPSDTYAFLNSKEKIYPGLNLSGYSNNDVDRITEKLLIETNDEKIKQNLEELSKILKNDNPIIFVYSPYYIYLSHNKNIKLQTNTLTEQKNRLEQINKWFVETDHIWKIFTKNN